MKLIVILAYKRPEYLFRCLDALLKCRGVKDWEIIISIDGGPEAMSNALIPDNDLWEVVTLEHSWGINYHNATAFNALSGSVSNIVAVEDDCVLSPDALSLADWFHSHPRRDEYLFMSLGKSSDWDPIDTMGPSYIQESSIIDSPHAFTFTKESWLKMRKVWNSKKVPNLGWDWSLSYEMFRHGWKALTPQLSRALNIGREGGTNATPEWFDANMNTQVVSVGSYTGPYEIKSLLPDDWTIHPADWMKEELAYAQK